MTLHWDFYQNQKIWTYHSSGFNEFLDYPFTFFPDCSWWVMQVACIPWLNSPREFRGGEDTKYVGLWWPKFQIGWRILGDKIWKLPIYTLRPSPQYNAIKRIKFIDKRVLIVFCEKSSHIAFVKMVCMDNKVLSVMRNT